MQNWGIVPDITVETHEITGSLPIELYAASVFFKYATDYVLEHDIETEFWPDSTCVADFRSYLTEEGFEWEDGEFSDNLYYIERSLFTEIAARTWDREMYYRMMTPHDETVQRALQYFKDGE